MLYKSEQGIRPGYVTSLRKERLDREEWLTFSRLKYQYYTSAAFFGTDVKSCVDFFAINPILAHKYKLFSIKVATVIELGAVLPIILDVLIVPRYVILLYKNVQLSGWDINPKTPNETASWWNYICKQLKSLIQNNLGSYLIMDRWTGSKFCQINKQIRPFCIHHPINNNLFVKFCYMNTFTYKTSLRKNKFSMTWYKGPSYKPWFI